MEEEEAVGRRGPSLGEIVEVYRQPCAREVGGAVQPPLPGRPAPPGSPPAARTGLWIFPGCLAVVLGVAAGSWIWYLLPAGSSADPSEYRYDHGWEEEEDASGALPSPPIRSGRAPCWRWRRTPAGS